MANTSLAIIAAAGKSKRWNNYMGGPKQLAPFGKERLIHRTIRLFKPHFDIILMGDDNRFEAHDIKITRPVIPSIFEGTAIGQSAQFWSNSHDRTVVVLGDVYFSQNAVNAIVNVSKDNIYWIGRTNGGKNGHPWGELFAISIPSSHYEIIKEAIEKVKVLRATTGSNHAGNSGWEIYRVLHGINLMSNNLPYVVTTEFINIDDETDDFDSPDEYDTWKKINKNLMK